MSTAVIWPKSKPEVEFQYGGRLGEFNGMSTQSHLPHFRVLPPGEFNIMIPELRVILQDAAPPSPLLIVSSATVLPSTASVPTSYYYLRQSRREMFLPVFVCLSVCLLARLLKNGCIDLDEMLRVDRMSGTWTN